MVRSLAGTQVQVFTVKLMIVLLTVIAKVLVKISARTPLPSASYCMIFLSPSRIVPDTVNFTFAELCIVIHICEKD
jgi:hypothetical protein